MTAWSDMSPDERAAHRARVDAAARLLDAAANLASAAVAMRAVDPRESRDCLGRARGCFRDAWRLRGVQTVTWPEWLRGE